MARLTAFGSVGIEWVRNWGRKDRVDAVGSRAISCQGVSGERHVCVCMCVCVCVRVRLCECESVCILVRLLVPRLIIAVSIGCSSVEWWSLHLLSLRSAAFAGSLGHDYIDDRLLSW